MFGERRVRLPVRFGASNIGWSQRWPGVLASFILPNLAVSQRDGAKIGPRRCELYRAGLDELRLKDAGRVADGASGSSAGV